MAATPEQQHGQETQERDDYDEDHRVVCIQKDVDRLTRHETPYVCQQHSGVYNRARTVQRGYRRPAEPRGNQELHEAEYGWHEVKPECPVLRSTKRQEKEGQRCNQIKPIKASHSQLASRGTRHRLADMPSTPEHGSDAPHRVGNITLRMSGVAKPLAAARCFSKASCSHPISILQRRERPCPLDPLVRQRVSHSTFRANR